MRRTLLLALFAPVLASAQLQDIAPISATPHGYPTGATTDVAISNSGRYAAMATANSSLLPGDTPGTPDVVVVDRWTRLFTRASEVQPLDRPPYEYRNLYVSNDGSTLYYSRRRPGERVQACRFSTVTNTLTVLATDRLPISATRDGSFAALILSPDDVRIFDASIGALRSVASHVSLPGAELQFRAMNATGSLLAVRSRISLIPTEAVGGNFLVTRWGKVTRIPEGYVTSISATGRYVGIITNDSFDVRDLPGSDNDAYRYDMQTGEWVWLSNFSGRELYDPQTARLSLSESGMVAGFTAQTSAGTWTFGRRVSEAMALPLGEGVQNRPEVSLSDTGDTFVLVEDGLSRFPYDLNPDADAFFTMIGNPNRFGLSYGFGMDFARVNSLAASRDSGAVFMSADAPFRGMLIANPSGGGTQPTYLYPSESERLATDASGRVVAFSALPAGGQLEVFDRDSGTLELVSKFSGGELNAPATQASVSPDGRYVAFQSRATNFEPGLTGEPQVYLYDRTLKSLRLVSRFWNGRPAPYGVNPVFTGDSKGLVYVSDPRAAPGYENYAFPEICNRVIHLDLATNVRKGAPPSSFVDTQNDRTHLVPLTPVPDATGQRIYFNDNREGADYINTIRVWDLPANKVRKVYSDAYTYVAAIAPEGDTLLVLRRNGDELPRLFHLPTRTFSTLGPVGRIGFPSEQVRTPFSLPAAFGPGRRLNFAPTEGAFRDYAFRATYSVPVVP